jgi:hypothetical protein
MGRALKYLFRLAVLATLGLIAYAYLDELPPPREPVEVALPVPAGNGLPPEPDPAPPATGMPAPAEEEAGGIMQE